MPRGTDFQAFDGRCPGRLIKPGAADQCGDSGPKACGRGAGSAMVDDCAACGKDGRVIHRFHNLDVFGMRDLGAVIRAHANQRSFPSPNQLLAGSVPYGQHSRTFQSAYLESGHTWWR
jgi:hypothetical protein